MYLILVTLCTQSVLNKCLPRDVEPACARRAASPSCSPGAPPQVDDLKAKLAIQEAELVQKNENADKLIHVVGVETEKVSKEKAIADEEEVKVEVINKVGGSRGGPALRGPCKGRGGPGPAEPSQRDPPPPAPPPAQKRTALKSNAFLRPRHSRPRRSPSGAREKRRFSWPDGLHQGCLLAGCRGPRA